MEDYIKTPLGRKSITAALSALLIVVCLNGYVEAVLDTVFGLETIEVKNDEFLDTSLGMATKYFVGLSVIKSILALLSSAQLDLVVIKGDIGKVFQSITETVDMVWKFFGYSMASITAQKVLLQFFKFFSVKIIVPLGAFFMMISVINLNLFRKLGIIFISSGFILYAAMPFTIFTSAIMLDRFAKETAIELDEKIGVLKIEVYDTAHGIETNTQNPGDKKFLRRQLDSVKTMLSGSVDIMTTAAMRHLGLLAIVFIISPLFFYGILYIVFTRIRGYLNEHEDIPDRLDGYIYKKAASGFNVLDRGIKKVMKPKSDVHE